MQKVKTIYYLLSFTYSKKSKKMLLLALLSIIILILSIWLSSYKINEHFNVYPNYPYIYTASPISLPLTHGLNNYKLLDDGNLLLYTRNPVTPYLVKCRADDTQRKICDYVIGNNSRIVSPT